MQIERIHIRLIEHPNNHRAVFPLEHAYVEDYWMSILGPTSVAVLRHVARRADTYADPGVTEDSRDLSVRFGLGNGNGRQAPMLRTLDRLCHFGAAVWDITPAQADTLAAVTIFDRIDVVPLAHVNRWNVIRQAEHRATVAAQLAEVMR